jgi:hypothetical protein
LRIAFDGLYNQETSLGVVSHALTAALQARHEVFALPWPESRPEAVGPRRYGGEPVDVALRLCDPHSATICSGRARAFVPILYYDGLQLAPEVVAAVTTLPHVIALSRFTQSILFRCGIRSRVHVLPLGVAPPPALARAPHDGIELLALGGHRKGEDLARRAVEKVAGVRLTVKAGSPVLSRAEWLAQLARYDYFLAVSRMESFGLVGLEAAAAGTALIYPMTSAYAEYAAGIPHGYALTGGRWSEHGWEIDPGELADLLGYLVRVRAQHYDRMEVRSAAEVHTWDRVARRLEEILEGILG